MNDSDSLFSSLSVVPSGPASIVNIADCEGNRAFGYKAAKRLNGLFKKVSKDGELEEIER